jgi:hypothetical protein
MPTIKPTLGRVVLYCSSAGVKRAAIICHVHSDTIVNLAVFAADGKSLGVTSVTLIAPDAPKPEFSSYCEYPPHMAAPNKKQDDSLAHALGPDVFSALKRIIVQVDQQIALELAGQQ